MPAQTLRYANCRGTWRYRRNGTLASRWPRPVRTVRQLLRQFAASFYADTAQPIVVDKCRSWTLEPNVKLLEAMTDDPKVIVMVRPLEQVVASLVAARRKAGWEGDIEAQLLRDGSEPIMRSLAGVEWARMNNDGKFLFVEYDDLVDRPEQTLARIYAFCRWQPFAHNFTDITNANPEPDHVYGIEGFHEVRPTLSRRAVNANLSAATLAECSRLDARR